MSDPDCPTLERTLRLPVQRGRGPWVVEAGSPDDCQAVILRPGKALTLGSGMAAGLRIRDRCVSARHCTVEATEQGVKVVDQSSTNGLYAGAARVREAVLPASGGTFVIGRTTVTVRCEERDDALPEVCPLPGIVGGSVAMRRVTRDVRRWARLQAPVLVLGESGTGKDLIARALHSHGRPQGPYVALNVGAIPDSLADAELFGHRRGAFTGAVTSRAGAFEQADGGTLFLDEIAELSPRVQVKLLRVVEDGDVRPVGSSAPLRVNVRIVSATWATLAERVAEGHFRPDLFHRIATVVIELPPLRDRKSDIPGLAKVLLARFESEFGPKRLTSAALARLVAHAWPGNVRELGSVLYRAAANCCGPDLRSEHIERTPSSLPGVRPLALASTDLLRLLECHDGNVSAAARAARVPRSTFRAWIDKAREPP